MLSKARNGFSLIELVAVITIAASVGAVLAPSMARMRGHMRGVSSVGNLSTIGQASAMYGIDHEDRIAAYSWRAGETYVNLGNGNSFTPSSDTVAAAYQLRDILYRATGRLQGSFRILTPTSRLVHRRYSHLVLADYMDNVGERLWADPSDINQTIWQDFPTFYDFVPYGQGMPQQFGYDTDSSWTLSSIKQLWAFGSSYQTVPHAWMPDTTPSYVPLPFTPHSFTTSGGFPHLGDRLQTEVAFPSAKVMMFEEFDRERVGHPYFAYSYTTPAKLMFDGSINTARTDAATLSVSPEDYSFGWKEPWYQHYLPLDKFPVPIGGLGDSTDLNMHYRWTLGGLQGIDYPQTLMPSFGR